MSENIQSIANGTYTLGNTNELTFQAGPGITIDSPSAGTVRIGNDETVLWSGDARVGTSATLSEPVSSFEYIDITFKVWERTDVKRTPTTYYNTQMFQYALGWGQSTNIINLACFDVRNDQTTVSVTSAVRFYLNGTTPATGSITGANGGISKIVGVNRISGSNA